MSRLVRGLAAIALACAATPFLGAGPARADTSVLHATNGAYFYSAGVDKPDASPAAPPNVTADADGVSPGNLAVASKAGDEDKVSFLYFDLFALPEGASVTKAVVTMKLVPQGPTDLSAQATAEKVVACQAGDKGFSNDDGAGLATNAPERKCADFMAKGTATKDGLGYQWDVTGLATTWVAGANDGLAFTRADNAPSSSFQVVFGPASTASLALEYSVPVAEEPAVVPPPVVDPPVPGVGVPVVGGFAPVPGSGFVPVPDTGGGVPTAPGPLVNETPGAVTPVQAAPRTTDVAAITPSLRPSTGFWLAGVALAVALALLSLVLGDNRVATTAGSRSRLSLALDGQRRSGLRPVLRTQP